MEEMNKWLAFSLSGGGGHHHTEQQSSAAMHPGISDWSADGAGGDANCRRTQYSSASSSSGDQLSMLMGAPAAAGSSSCSNNRDSNMISELYEQPEAPKLENFLGLHPFAAQCNPYADCPDSISRPNYLASYNLASGNSNNHCSEDATGETNSCNNLVRNQPNNGSSSIGLSMIKSWLRNQPLAPPAGPPLHGDNQQQLIIEHSNGTASSAQNNNLSLSMSAEGVLQSLSSSSAPLSLLAPTMPHGAGTSLLSDLDRENSSSNNNNDNKLQQQDSFAGMDSQNSSSSCAIEAVPRRSLDTFGQRTSIYRGVTRHRWTGRYEAHLWDNSCRREGQTRKGRQVYLGGYDKEEKAARAYDLAALKYWGPTTTTNFPISNYEKELEEMKHMTRQEFVASLRRKSSGFSRGASIYRGVTRHHQHGRWQARIGRVAGNKDLYLGTFSTQEEAAEAYDVAAIKFRGLNAVTNFDMSRYDVKSILESTTLPVGTVRRLKDVAYQHHHQGQGQGQSQGHHRATPTDTFQGADFLRNGSLMNPYENHAGGGAMATVLGGIHSYSDTAGWPSVPGTALSLPQAAPGGPFPLYGYGQSVQRTWGCKQEQQDQDADDNSAFNHRRHHLSSSGISNTTHNFFQPLDSTGSSMMMLPPNYLMNSAAVVSNPDFQVLSTAYASNAAEYGSVNDHHNHDNGNDHRSVMYGSSADNAAAYGNYQAAAAARILYQSNHSTDGSNGDRYVSWVPTGIPMAGSSPSNTSSRSSPVGNTNMSMNRNEAPTFTVWPE